MFGRCYNLPAVIILKLLPCKNPDRTTNPPLKSLHVKVRHQISIEFREHSLGTLRLLQALQRNPSLAVEPEADEDDLAHTIAVGFAGKRRFVGLLGDCYKMLIRTSA